MDLLLIADEQINMIEKYLYRGEMFGLRDDGLKALCVVTEEEPGVYEIKNIVTVPQYQRQGHGKQLISCVADYYKDKARIYMSEQAMCLRYCASTKSAALKNRIS